MPRRSATRVITVLNRKGGVGKTHVCWLIASLAADHDKRVLVIDLDPQANISGSFLNEIPSVGVERLFDPTADPQIGPLICRAFNLPVDVIPASPQLEPFVLCSSQAWEQCDLHLSLAAALSDVSDDYDYILLDCPPNLALTTTAALCVPSSPFNCCRALCEALVQSSSQPLTKLHRLQQQLPSHRLGQRPMPQELPQLQLPIHDSFRYMTAAVA